MQILNIVRDCREFFRKSSIEYSDNNIIYINWQKCDWFEKFIRYHFPNKHEYNILFTGVDNNRIDLRQYNNYKKIFFSGENLEERVEHRLCKEQKSNSTYWWLLRRYKLYNDYRINDVDLSLGYKKSEVGNYMHFPLWIIYLIPPDIKMSKIYSLVNELNKIKSQAYRDAVCINKHDCFGVRSKICDDLNTVLRIDYPGKWRNNTSELWNNYNNDKIKYLNLYKFNICPENMDAKDYCTEKIFDAIRAGCIPIYYGCLGNPEPNIINRNFIINWDVDGDNYDNMKLISKLKHSDEFYRKFISQDKFTLNSSEYIIYILEQLRERIRILIS